MYRLLFTMACLMVLGAGCAENPTTGTGSITAEYLMTFHACDEKTGDCHNPKNHIVYLAQSNDGVSWNLVDTWTPVQGSVPDVIRRDNTLYVYTPGKLIRYHLDTDEQEDAVSVTINDLPDGFVDPTLALDDDGNLVLFFLYGKRGSDPAGCSADEKGSCTKYIGSATEVPGSDGKTFTLNDGTRATIPLSSQTLLTASDPDIFFNGEEYILYTAHGSRIDVWTSNDLHGTYTRKTEKLSTRNSIPSGFYDIIDDEYWTFAHGKQAGGTNVISRAVHDGLTKSIDSEWSVVIDAESVGLPEDTHVESPGFAVNTP